MSVRVLIVEDVAAERIPHEFERRRVYVNSLVRQSLKARCLIQRGDHRRSQRKRQVGFKRRLHAHTMSVLDDAVHADFLH